MCRSPSLVSIYAFRTDFASENKSTLRFSLKLGLRFFSEPEGGAPVNQEYIWGMSEKLDWKGSFEDLLEIMRGSLLMLSIECKKVLSGKCVVM